MTNPGNFLAGARHYLDVDVLYNLGDAVNKIGFGLVVWNLARAGERQAARLGDTSDDDARGLIEPLA